MPQYAPGNRVRLRGPRLTGHYVCPLAPPSDALLGEERSRMPFRDGKAAAEIGLKGSPAAAGCAAKMTGVPGNSGRASLIQVNHLFADFVFFFTQMQHCGSRSWRKRPLPIWNNDTRPSKER